MSASELALFFGQRELAEEHGSPFLQRAHPMRPLRLKFIFVAI